MDNIKEEFNAMFDDEDSEKMSKNTVPLEKYEELKVSIKQVPLVEFNVKTSTSTHFETYSLYFNVLSVGTAYKYPK